MSYQYLGKLSNGNSKYKVTLNVYRDCFQSDVPLDDVIPIGVHLNNTDKDLYQTFNFNLITKTNVKPPGSVDCDYYAQKVCIQYGLYEGTIELPPFAGGYHVTFVRCCRNVQTNLPEQGGGTPFLGQTYYCFIPDSDYKNSSPVFSGVPSPFMCAKDTTNILFNAFDPDGDELSYKVVTPFQGGKPTDNGAMPTPPANLTLPILPVQYETNYNGNKPFGINNGSITSINAVTGLATFLAPSSGSYVVGVEVTEKRNGVVLSSIRMDLQILVLDCPPNGTPSIKSSASKVFNIQAGQTLCFDVIGKDPDADKVKLTATGPVIDGSNGFIGTKGTFSEAIAIEKVTSEFCWKTDCDHARETPYLVTFVVEDDGCPPKFNYLDVEINVSPFESDIDLSGPIDVCMFNAYKYTTLNGKNKSTYQWEVVNGEIIGDSTKSSAVIDWGDKTSGSIRVIEVSEHGCFGDTVELAINISESPATPDISGKDTLCEGEVGVSYSVPLNSGHTYSWSIDNGTISAENQNIITLGTYSSNGFQLKVVEINSFGCASDTGKLNGVVSIPLPDINGPVTVCPNATNVDYNATNNAGSSYQWSVVGGNKVSGGNTSSIKINWGNEGAGTVRVVETNRHGCISAPVTLNITKTYKLVSNPIVGPTDVCEFDKGVAYNSLDVSGNVYDWTIVGGVQSFGDSTFLIRVDWGAAGLGSVALQEKAYDAVNDKYCFSDIQTLNVTIYPKPNINEIIGIQELCQTDSPSLYTISGFIGSTFEWALDGNTTAIQNQGNDSIYITWNSPGNFVLSVKEITSAGCKGELIDTIIIVNPKPTTSQIIGASVVCPENVLAIPYSVIGSSTSTYNWVVGGSNGFTGQGSNAIVVDWEPTLPFGKVSVIEISDKGCVGDSIALDIEIDRLAIDLRYVSVGDPDDRMIINWKLKEAATANEFEIEKRKFGTNNWEKVRSITGTIFNYTESPINTDLNAFEYRVVATNKCGTLITSEPHTNILLEGYQDDNFDIHMNFSDYLGWENGVSNYSIFESINRGPFSIVSSGEMPNDNILILNNPDQFRKCYRIYADEILGESTNSWSNEICFVFMPEIFVPNAFTADNNNLNDAFGVQGLAINEYSIKIFNRWGEKLYESTNIDEKWLPKYQGKDVPMGTYIYVITYSDFDKKTYTKTGTINLIR